VNTPDGARERRCAIGTPASHCGAWELIRNNECLNNFVVPSILKVVPAWLIFDLKL